MRTITRQFFFYFCLRCMTFTRTNPLKKFKFHTCVEESLDNEPEIRCTAVCNVLATSANRAPSACAKKGQQKHGFEGFIQRVRRSQTMAKVKSGLSRSKTDPRFKSRRSKVAVIVAHAQSYCNQAQHSAAVYRAVVKRLVFIKFFFL